MFMRIQGDQFMQRPDWGETLSGKHHPVLCVLDLTTEEVTTLDSDPIIEDFSASQVCYDSSYDSSYVSSYVT